MKNGTKRESIIEAAAEIADEKGFANLTLKELAENLGVKPPSLYKHFGGGLDELNKELMLYGWRLLDKEITNSVIGKAKDDAIIALCCAYRKFVSEHKGLYEAMQWYNMYLSDKHLQASEGIVDIMFRILSFYGLTEEQKVHTVRMLRAFLQGFCTIECHGGYGNPVSLNDTFDYSLHTILTGIAALQRGAEQ